MFIDQFCFSERFDAEGKKIETEEHNEYSENPTSTQIEPSDAIELNHDHENKEVNIKD